MATSTCTETVNNRISELRFEEWKRSTDTELNRIQGGGTPTAGRGLTVIRNEILETEACLEEKLLENGYLPTGSSLVHQQILDTQRELANKEEDLQIAKDRVSYIREKDRPVSYYESWFPLGRPAKPFVVTLLLGFTCFLLFTIFFILAGMAGYSVVAQWPSRTVRPGQPSSSMLEWLPSTPKLFGGAILIAVVIGLYYFAVRR
jgi:hypothetical protein